MNIYRDTKLDHKVSLKQGLKKSRYQTTSGKKLNQKLQPALRELEQKNYWTKHWKKLFQQAIV